MGGEIEATSPPPGLDLHRPPALARLLLLALAVALLGAGLVLGAGEDPGPSGRDRPDETQPPAARPRRFLDPLCRCS
jgi:hypothetical protein